MEYPKIISLIKVNTREDAEFPQTEKYHDGTERRGYIWEFNEPKIGERFKIMRSKLYTSFITSTVVEIVEKSDTHYLLRTRNSLYKINIITHD